MFPESLSLLFRFDWPDRAHMPTSRPVTGRRLEDTRIGLAQSRSIPWDWVDGFGSKEEGRSGCWAGNQSCWHVLDAANSSICLETECMTNGFW